MKKNITERLKKVLAKNKKVEEVTLKYEPNTNSSGFVRLDDSLINFPELDLYDRLVYSALKNYSEFYADKKSKVTNETIAKRLGIGSTSVSERISHLQQLGIIAITYEKGNQRAICIQRNFAEEQPEAVAYKKSHDTSSATSDDEKTPLFLSDLEESKDEEESATGGISNDTATETVSYAYVTERVMTLAILIENVAKFRFLKEKSDQQIKDYILCAMKDESQKAELLDLVRDAKAVQAPIETYLNLNNDEEDHSHISTVRFKAATNKFLAIVSECIPDIEEQLATRSSSKGD